jgi:hypothetical protein
VLTRRAINPGTRALRCADVGKLLDGTVFDSADEFSFELGAGEVIKVTRAACGWRQQCSASERLR